MADFTYHQSSGQLFLGEDLIGECYSGFENGWNNPAMEQVENCGPIPRGWWGIWKPQCVAYVSTLETGNPCPDCGGTLYHKHGPFVLRLISQIGTNTYGRDGFLMHGDSREHPGHASHGCIVASRPIRERVAAEKDAMLKVV